MFTSVSWHIYWAQDKRSSKGKGKQLEVDSTAASSTDEAVGAIEYVCWCCIRRYIHWLNHRVAPTSRASKVVVQSVLPGTPSDWEGSSVDEGQRPATSTPLLGSRSSGYKPKPDRHAISSEWSIPFPDFYVVFSYSIPSPDVCEVMNNEVVQLSMNKNLCDTYPGLVNLMWVTLYFNLFFQSCAVHGLQHSWR